MSNKGDNRSNTRMTDEDILSILEAKDSVQIFEEDHKAFSAGKSNIQGNVERLFLCICE